MPSWKFSDLIVIHAKLCPGFLKTLLYGPSHAAEPHHGSQAHAARSIGDKKIVLRALFYGSPYQQPHSLVPQIIFGKYHPPFCELVFNRSLGDFSDLAE